MHGVSEEDELEDCAVTTQDKDIVVDNLKARWFDLAKKEDMPNTPNVTKQLDNLTEAIRKMQGKEGV